MSAPRAVHSSHPPTHLFLGVQMKILLSSRQTNRQFSMIEGLMLPGGDGGLHVHHFEDESMYLIEGSLEVTIGDQVFMLKAGESYFAPRDVPQRLRNVGHVPARALLGTTPGGFDEFIESAGVRLDAGKPLPAPAPPSQEELDDPLALAGEFGIEIMAPPELGPA